MNNQQKLKDRFYKFALAIIKLVRTLPRELTGAEIGKQVLRAGTSVAANYEEASGAFSKADFIYKISISFREAKEAHLWLRLIRDSGLRNTEAVDSLAQEAFEISNILAKSIKTARGNSQT